MMQCKCIEIIEKKMVERFNESNRFKQNVVSVKIEGKTLLISPELDTMKLQTYSLMEINLANGKKRKENLLHRYCPFCGKLEAEVSNG